MSQLIFQAKITLDNALEIATGVWQFELRVSDNEGIFGGNTIAPGDVVVIDTSVYETGTLTRYVVSSVLTSSFNTAVVNTTYDPTNDNASIPDPAFSVGLDGIVTRPSANYKLLPVPSPGVQLLPDKFSIYLQNYNFNNIVDNIGTTRLTSVIGNGVDVDYTIEHGFNTYEVIVQVRDASTKQVVLVDIGFPSPNTVIVQFAMPPAPNSYEVVIIG